MSQADPAVLAFLRRLYWLIVGPVWMLALVALAALVALVVVVLNG